MPLHSQSMRLSVLAVAPTTGIEFPAIIIRFCNNNVIIIHHHLCTVSQKNLHQDFVKFVSNG